MEDSQSKKLESALREYDKIHEFSLEAYRHYYRSLTFLFIAIGGVIGLATNNLDRLIEKIGLLGISAIPMLFFINAWVAFWVYLNRELWAYRNYLSDIEGFIRTLLALSKTDSIFCFYKTGMRGMYQKTSVLFNTRCTNVLNGVIAVFIVVIYLPVVFLAWRYGFDALADRFKPNAFLDWTLRTIAPPSIIVISILLGIVSLNVKTVLSKDDTKSWYEDT